MSMSVMKLSVGSGTRSFVLDSNVFSRWRKW